MLSRKVPKPWRFPSMKMRFAWSALAITVAASCLIAADKIDQKLIATGTKRSRRYFLPY